jgi:hypothetical protein
MTTRRSRPPRSRKTRTAEPIQNDVAVLTLPDALDRLGALAGHEHVQELDPTETGQLRALEAGWDELLS